MSPQGHVTLDGRPYLLANPRAYRRYPANQMAPKMGQGQSEYRDLTDWEAWIVENWQAGIGAKAQDEGFLYGEVDSRVPNQIVLPPLLRVTDGRNLADSAADLRYTPASIGTTLTVGPAGTTRVSILIDTGAASYTLRYVWFYLQTQVAITTALYAADANGLPTGAALASGSIVNVSQDYAYRWYKTQLDYALATPNKYCLVLYPTNGAHTFVLGGGASYTGAVTGVYDGAAWSASSASYPAYLTDVHMLGSGADVVDVVRFNSQTYMAAGNQLYKFSATNHWTAVGAARAATITDLEVVGASLYIGLGNSTNYDTMTTAEVYAGGGSAGRIFYNAGNYLWKAVSDSVYYNNGTAWSAAIGVGSSQYSVRGISEVDGDIYAANDDGLFLIAPGDIAIGITPWGSADSSNGVDLLTHHGVLYSPSAGQYLQINGGSVRNIWTVRKDELPSWASGRVVSACAMINWPVVLVRADSNDGFDTVWAWQDLGWHFLAQLPQGIHGTAVRYDRANQRLWIGTAEGMMFHVYVSNYLINPYEDTGYAYMPFGWFETNWFSSGILESDKDIESLYVRGRGIDEFQTVQAYYQDDSTGETVYLVDENGDNIGDESGNILGDETQQWIYFATYTLERDEQRWALGAYRPNTREFRLGFLLTTTASGATPKLEAHRLKYQVMIQDWWGWDLPLQVGGKGNSAQQMLDGGVQSYTNVEQLAHLDGLVKGYVPPFVYTDLNGREYEVKVKQASFSPEKVEYFNGDVRFDGVYNVQIVEVHDSQA